MEVIPRRAAMVPAGETVVAMCTATLNGFETVFVATTTQVFHLAEIEGHLQMIPIQFGDLP